MKKFLKICGKTCVSLLPFYVCLAAILVLFFTIINFEPSGWHVLDNMRGAFYFIVFCILCAYILASGVTSGLYFLALVFTRKWLVVFCRVAWVIIAICVALVSFHFLVFSSAIAQEIAPAWLGSVFSVSRMLILPAFLFTFIWVFVDSRRILKKKVAKNDTK
jgi:hypothetical protein